MSQSDTLSATALARKYRKKLRQIENLEHLNRALSDDERIKVNSKSATRDQLREVLEKLEEESALTDTTGNYSAETSSSFNEDDHFHAEGTGSEQIEVEHDSAVENGSGEPCGQIDQSSVCGVSPKSGPPEPPATLMKGVEEEVVTKAHSQKDGGKQPKKSKSERSGVQLSKCHCKVINMEGHSDIVTSLVVVNGRVVTASRDTTLKSWDLTTGEELRTFGSHTESVTFVLALDATCGRRLDSSFSLDDHLIVSSSFDCTFKMWSLNMGQLLKSVYTFNPLTQICYMPSLKQLITSSDGGKLELWEMSGDNLYSLLAHETSITSIVVSDEMVFSSSSQGIVKIHKVKEDNTLACLFVSDEVKSQTGQPLALRHVHCVVLTPQGLLCGDDGRNLKLLDWKKGHMSKFPNHTSRYSSTDTASCHDGYLVSSSYNLDEGLGYINVRQMETMAYLATIDDHETERILALDFCIGPSGDLVIVTGGLDLKLWHVLSSSASKTDLQRSGDDIIGLQFRQALSVAATASESDYDGDTESEDEDFSDENEAAEDIQDNGGDSQQSWVWSWCSIL